MTFTEAFLILNIPHSVKATLEEKIIPELERCAIENIMLIEENAEKETEFSFKYSNDKPVLNSVTAELINAGCTIRRLLVHLSPEISCVRDVYDASAKGFAIQDALQNIANIKAASTSSNGIVRIEVDTASNNYDMVVKEAINAIVNI